MLMMTVHVSNVCESHGGGGSHAAAPGVHGKHFSDQTRAKCQRASLVSIFPLVLTSQAQLLIDSANHPITMMIVLIYLFELEGPFINWLAAGGLPSIPRCE